MKIKKDDKVIVIAGKDKGKEGTVLEAIPGKDKVVVDGVGIVKKHVTARMSANKKGEIVEKNMPIAVSNVMLIDPKSKKPTRVGYKRDEKGKKTRIAKKSGEVIS